MSRQISLNLRLIVHPLRSDTKSTVSNRIKIVAYKAKLNEWSSSPQVEVLDPKSGGYIVSHAAVFRHRLDLNGTAGYPLHESCWDILRCFFSKDEIANGSPELAILYDILERTPYQDHKLNWPHGYYGMEKYQLPTWDVPEEYPFAHEDPVMHYGFTHNIDQWQSTMSIPDFLSLHPGTVANILEYCR